MFCETEQPHAACTGTVFAHSGRRTDTFARGRDMARCRPDVSRSCVWALTSAKRMCGVLTLGVALIMAQACTREQTPERAHDPAVPAAPAMAGPRASVALDAEDGQWTM